MLHQPQGQQGLDEDGPWAGAGRSHELPAECAGARCCAQAHQRPRPGSNHGVRHRQCDRYCGWPSGELVGRLFSQSGKNLTLQHL